MAVNATQTLELPRAQICIGIDQDETERKRTDTAFADTEKMCCRKADIDELIVPTHCKDVHSVDTPFSFGRKALAACTVDRLTIPLSTRPTLLATTYSTGLQVNLEHNHWCRIGRQNLEREFFRKMPNIILFF